MTEIYDGVVAIILRNNEALLQKKDMGYSWFPGKWCLFGGGLEKEEDPESSLIRELSEEISYSPKEINFYKEFQYKDKAMNKIREGKQIVYFCNFDSEISQLKINEGCGFAFFTYGELDNYPIIERDLNILKMFYKDKGLISR